MIETLSIDDVLAPAEGSLLDACRGVGADVPAFCHDPHVTAGAHCRSCIVEVDGRFVAACATPARAGAVVHTQTPRLQAYRRHLGELIRAESDPVGEVGDRLDALGVPPAQAHAGRVDDTHPLLRIDLGRCILCRRCEAVCAEVQGQFVFAVEGRGVTSRVTWGPTPFAETACVSCGACAATCPAGAITDTDRLDPRPVERTVRTTCGYCGVGCQLDVHVGAGAVLSIDGAEADVNRGHLCVKGRYGHGFVGHPDRLRTPLVRKDGALVPVEWDEAIEHVGRELRRLAGHVAGLSSARATNEENYLFQKWIRGGLGSNDVDCCARVCHAPSAAGLKAAFGTGAATNCFSDVELADLVMVIGANPTEAHPVMGARIKRAVLEGAGLVVIDPRRTELAALADVHVAVRPGANVPLLQGIAQVLVAEDLVDHAFLATRVEGWEAFRLDALRHTPESLADVTGVDPVLVREVAHRLAAAARPMMFHGLGVTEHKQGTETVELIANLALLLGSVGRPGVGVNPLRGQGNVQGAADMGAQPDQLPGYQPVSDPAVRARVGELWGRPVPEAPGRTLPQIYDAIFAGDVRALVVFGEDLAQTDPHEARVREALARLELLVVIELFPSETAKLAHVVLPGASFLEKDGTFTNGERRVQRVRAAVPPAAGRADWQLLLQLMAATGWPQELDSPAAILAEVAAIAPLFRGLGFAALDAGQQWPVPAVGHPGSPRLHVDRFTRGLGKLTVVDWRPSPAFDATLQLVTGRVLAHYNAGTMTRRSASLGILDHDTLEVHPEDAARAGVGDGDRVVVESERGVAYATAHVTDRVQPGTLFLSFHFPETRANAVTSDVRDGVTGCPEYKLTGVTLRRAEE